MAISSSSKKIKVKCSGGVVLEIEEALVKASPTMKLLMEEKEYECENEIISLPNISTKTVCKVIEYMNQHVDPHADYSTWDAEFIEVDQDLIFDLILAGEYLQIDGLLHLGCMTIANKIKGKSTEHIRETFNIKNDFTPQEEEENRKFLRFRKQ